MNFYFQERIYLWKKNAKKLSIGVICISTAAQNSGKCFQIRLMLIEEVGRLLEEAFFLSNFSRNAQRFFKIPGK